MEAVWAGARAVVVHALWDRPVAACITVVIMVVPVALAYLLFSEYDIHPWQLWKSKSGSKAVNMALGGAGLSDEELQRLMLEHDAAQDNVILTESGLRHRDPRELGGDCGRYRWLQTDTEIVVEAPLPSGTLPSQIRVKVHTAYLAVHVKDDTIVSGKLSRKVMADDCFWEVEDDEEKTELGGKKLTVTLVKMEKTRGNRHWKSVVVGAPRIDTAAFGPPVLPVPAGDPHALREALDS